VVPRGNTGDGGSFIAGTAATAAASVYGPVYGQADARSPTIKRIAIVDLARKPEEITINGARAWKAYFRS
jgi:hypothetical protein